ncbi:hypothetical protein F5Y05DRAFT_371266 [Hypoxylon sp. FL0543]|nr:hypothetical protein F5Y05DRAFT_371266 [Hypoxylon sp. FL0543]
MSSPQRSTSSIASDGFPFLELPLDIVVMIFYDFLRPAAAAALSLTCKDLASIFRGKPSNILREIDRKEFLLLLEKELTPQRPTYYCHWCARLHYFDLAREHSALYSHGELCLYKDCRRSCVQFTGLIFPLHHFRLILNQYQYGAPDTRFVQKLLNPSQPVKSPWRWIQKWSAKVISGQLFLSATHKFRFKGTEEGFRQTLDKNEYRICRHVSPRKQFQGDEEYFDEYDKKSDATPGERPRLSISRLLASDCVINSFRMEGEARIPSDYRRLRLCTEVPGSCVFCATDYTTTLQKRVVEGPRMRRRPWVLTIVAYYLVGDCDSPLDRKWEVFCGARFSFPEPCRKAIFDSVPGDVKERWESAA